MAFRSISCLITAGKSVNTHFLNKCHAASAIVMHMQTANLTSTGGKPMKRPEPWPYKDTSYYTLAHLFDSTTDRFDDNSKIIAVEGNIATGKTELAQKLAKEFDMKYIPDGIADEEDVFWNNIYDCDMRIANDVLPEGAKYVDLKTFYTSANPEKLGIARTQIKTLSARMDNYYKGSNHLFNTGQGIVVDRSMLGDIVYADVLCRSGYSSKKAFAYYRQVYKTMLHIMWKPHVIIYLGAPASYIQQQIKKRAVPHEVGSKVLTDDYIKTIDSVYRQNFLQEQMKPYCEILVYDAHNLPDFDIIVEDLENLNLTPPIQDEPNKFKDWNNKFEAEFNKYRTYLSNGRKIYQDWSFRVPVPICWEYEDHSTHYGTVKKYLSELKTIENCLRVSES